MTKSNLAADDQTPDTPSTTARPCPVSMGIWSRLALRAALVRERRPAPPAVRSQYRDMSLKAQRRRQIRAHNHKVRGRVIKSQRGSGS